jgi:hypothetical protein
MVLPAEDLGALRARMRQAGLPYEERSEGLLVRDPWGIAVLVSPA